QSFGGNNKNNKQQIVFPGHYDDEETNLYYNFRRFYSPEKGRFIRPDPIGAIINKKEQGTKNNNLYS
ncbi:MAG: hypothetical protein GWN30_09230, partial [Gammaproteobacteria bacterium]|nr:hypothetical protein [Gammaproteobacteria bacterium]NIW99522.1 hypothetical protein [Phycisphaerae bacterium]